MTSMESDIDYICKDSELLCSALQELGLCDDKIDTLSIMYRGATDEHKKMFRQSFQDQLQEYWTDVFNAPPGRYPYGISRSSLEPAWT